LRAAGSTGTAGPNLDDLRPSQGAVASQVTYGGGGMPSFSSSLSAARIQTLAAWVAGVAGSPSAAATTGGATPPGMTATEVRRIQAALARLGYFHHAVTGYYGPVTIAAVRRFQRAAGLKPDGVWGPQSQAALARKLG
jgi:peptidoglycan hydrolase-like protein with peptidoglycan-binding domain